MIAGSELRRAPVPPAHPGLAGGWPPRPATTAAGRLAAPLRAVRREARHPGHQRRRPDRRRRPDPGGRRAAPWATRRPSTSAWCRAPTAASSPSTSCPTWPSGSRSSLLNVLEERDIQVRGYQLRLPLDLLLVASANPEDYTNRGRIITPLKDRFGAEIRTHYPLDLDLEIDAGPRRRRRWSPRCPTTCSRSLARFTRGGARVAGGRRPLRRLGPVRRSRRPRPSPRPRCAAPACAASARRWPGSATPSSVTSTLRGKVEFESGEEGRETEILAHLLRTATAETFRARLAGLDLSGFTDLVAEGDDHRDRRAGRGRRAARARSAPCPAWPRCSTGSAWATRPTPGEAASGVEFVLEGLHLTRRLAKDADRRRPHGLRELSGAVSRRNRIPVRRLAGRARPARPAVRRAGGRRRGRRARCSAGGSLRDALRDLLRRGPRGRPRARRPAGPGPPDAPRGAAPRQPRRRGDPGPAAARPGARGRARRAAPAATTTTPGSPRRCWTTCPGPPRGPCEELSDYDWASDEARAIYQQILDGLRREVVEQRFAGMKRGAAGPRPGRRRPASRRCWATSTTCSASTPAARTPTDAFAEFMAKHGEFFPEQPGERRRADRLAGPAGRGGRAADALADARSSARSWPS